MSHCFGSQMAQKPHQAWPRKAQRQQWCHKKLIIIGLPFSMDLAGDMRSKLMGKYSSKPAKLKTASIAKGKIIKRPM